MDDTNTNNIRLEIELLKRDISHITLVFDKIDKIIEKIEKQQEHIVDKTNNLIEKRENTTKQEFVELYNLIENTEKTIHNRIDSIERMILPELKRDVETINETLAVHINDDTSLQKRISKMLYIGYGVIIVLLWLLNNRDLVYRLL